jgi:probable phosphoglycerate mutase
MRLWLIRHGQSQMNARRRVQGWIDSPLSALGRSQGEAVARRLEREKPDLLYASTLRRAYETAEIIAQALGGVPIVPDDRLRERDVGQIAGLNSQEIEEQYPGLLEKWRGTRFVAPPGGERTEDFWGRVIAAFQQITEGHPDQIVGVVTHGGVLAVYLGYLLGMEAGRWAPFSFGNGSLTAIDFTDGSFRVQVVNDRCHLDEVG